MLITHDQDVDEAIEALYEAEYQNGSEPDDSIAQPKLDDATNTEEAASSPDKAVISGPDQLNEDGQSQESGADDHRKRKRTAARDRKLQAKIKQKQQRKAKKQAVDDEQQEAKVTSELRQLYIWKTHSSGRTESMTFLN